MTRLQRHYVIFLFTIHISRVFKVIMGHVADQAGVYLPNARSRTRCRSQDLTISATGESIIG
jgi:hypothetical protein